MSASHPRSVHAHLSAVTTSELRRRARGDSSPASVAEELTARLVDLLADDGKLRTADDAVLGREPDVVRARVLDLFTGRRVRLSFGRYEPGAVVEGRVLTVGYVRGGTGGSAVVVELPPELNRRPVIVPAALVRTVVEL